MTQPTKIYLNHIKQNLNTGAATEHTHRPALAEFIESLAASIKVINEPRRIACGAPDLAVLQNGLMIGHVEAKDVGAPLDTAARSAQLKRYRAALDNLILTDYLEFRWYVAGKHRETVCLARWDGANLKCESGGAAALVELFTNFLAHKPQPIATPRELAGRLARLAHLIREIIVTAFETDQASNLLRGWRHAFSEVLVADLDQPEKVGEFADMFAQTLAYGLFSARVMYSPPHPPAPSPCNGEGETRALAPSPHNGEDEARAIAPSLRSGEGVGGEVSSPRSGEGVGGEVSSPLRSGEGTGGAVSSSLRNGEEIEGEASSPRSKVGAKRATPELWAKLKPVARQMRHEPTRAEKVLWQRLRGRKLAGVKFRRQHVIERFIVDFYAAQPRLVVEVDGPIHEYSREEDAIRQEYLERQGLRVLRFTNEQVMRNIESVLAAIAEVANSTTLEEEPHPPAPSPLHGEGETRAIDPSPHNGEDGVRVIAPSLRSGEGVGGEVSSPHRGGGETCALVPSLRSGEGVGGEVSSPRSGEEARGRGFNAFTRQAAQKLIPKTNPFLRKFFYQITGPDLDDEPYAGFVNDLVQLLAQTDMGEILANFGKRTRQEDPTVHFYETFLAAYDPALREMRGVYYTPAPVVSFIVRSVDALLKMKFGLAQGLADTSKVTVENTAVHKVLILDPATGTATFPYAVIDFIREQFMQGGNAGMWSGYVREHLLPRIFGFELLMAPYAVAHFKLALQLAGHDLPEAQRATWAYDFARDERLGIYLTNALEEPEHEIPTLWGPLQIVTQEAEAANQVKQDQPIMVVIGNPPYAVSSSNQGAHIEGLMARYKEVVRGERNIQPLSDDYIKFIRFAHDRVERTGYGVIGFITNHSYLSGLIHRGMREELLKTFNEIYILNLHGNTLMSELAPDGSANENVFDIRQGVAIVFFVKGYDDENTGRVYYADLWGTRQEKYTYLLKNDLTTTAWQELETPAPHFFFVPKDFDLSSEYERGWSVADMFPLCVSGIKTHRDDLVIGFDERELYTQISMVRGERFSDDELRHRLRLRDNGLWALSAARETLRRDKDWEKSFTRCLYRPFDIRPIFYHEALIDRARNDVMQHMLQPNLALVTTRLFVGEHFTSVLASRYITEMKTGEATRGTYCFPLYLYITAENSMGTIFANGKPTREPNLSPQFLAAVKAKLKISFVPDGANTSQDGFGPQDIFSYIYALLHSPTYRVRYAEFLKIDFPRVPLTSDNALFWQLVALGQQLIELHLLESPHVEQPITNYPIPGSNEVARRGGYPKYTPPDPAQEIGGRVHINKQQYFAGIPKEVWEFQVGGYQVLHKWLKDRRGRKLTYDDLTHYQKIVGALRETLRLMAEIDGAITRWPVE